MGVFLLGFYIGRQDWEINTIGSIFTVVNINILALFLSPVVAAVIAVYVSEVYLKRKVFEKKKKFEILVDLVSYRDAIVVETKHRKEMPKLLNSLILFYSDDEEIKSEIKKYWKGAEGEKDRKERLLNIIVYIAHKEGFKNLTKEDLNEAFI